VGGKRGARVTVGIPGTGLSYSEQLNSRGRRDQAPVEFDAGEPSEGLGGGLRTVVVVLGLPRRDRAPGDRSDAFRLAYARSADRSACAQGASEPLRS
jgi:hypothetical protein